MSDRNLDHLHPLLKPLCEQWLKVCHEQDIESFVTMTFRSNEDQDYLYRQGRTIPGRIVTNAKGGQSPHNIARSGKPASCAFDFAIKKTDGSLNWNVRSIEFQTAVTIGKSLGLDWGGDFPGNLGDYCHMQLKNWKEL